MAKSDVTESKGQAIEFEDFVVESTTRIEVPRILEQLKKISELKIDNFILPSGVEFENTVKEMFSIIKDLEGHLRDMLTLNTSLREEMRDTKKGTDKLRREKETAVHPLGQGICGRFTRYKDERPTAGGHPDNYIYHE